MSDPTSGVVRVYEPSLTTEPYEGILVDVLADGSRRQVVRAVALPLFTQAGAISLAPGASDVVVHVAAPPGLSVVGFVLTGEGDCTAELTADGTLLGAGWLSAIHRVDRATLPTPYAAATGAVIALTVTCAARASAQFKAVLYGEVAPS